MKKKPRLNNTYLVQGSRFVLVGILNGIIGLGTTYAAYNLFNVPYPLANVLGYTLGLINSFILNKKWTFQSKKDPKKEIILFLLIFGVSYSLNLGSVVVSVELLHLDPNLAQLVGVFFYTSSNFFGNKLLTFR
jgi:putative flippase GtrA